MYVRSAQDGERPEICQVDDPAPEEEAAMRRAGPAAMGDDATPSLTASTRIDEEDKDERGREEEETGVEWVWVERGMEEEEAGVELVWAERGG
ncbi:hypothetical protein MRB53_012804 [Persea americana]|uniref:Uncharacterized protein n=1 Tax=Persea americana TaxID=3435 RepID=A0ACC2M020_PERAE|nr:hypothetical protein MRB53_012804 [Persea americana]